MALFVDSSDPKEIKALFSWGAFSGVTTNPLIISRESPGADLAEAIREVLSASTGDVSVELTTETEEEMLAEALGYHAWDPQRITIKVPFSEVGLRVLHRLTPRGVKTNAHLPDGLQPGVPGGACRGHLPQRVLGADQGHGLRRASGHRGHPPGPRPRGAADADHRRFHPAPDGRERGRRARAPTWSPCPRTSCARWCGTPAPSRPSPSSTTPGASAPALVDGRAGVDAEARRAAGAGDRGRRVRRQPRRRPPPGAGGRGDHPRQLLHRLAAVRPRAAPASSRRTSSIRWPWRRALEGCDLVFHLAANADIKDNLLEPRKCVEQNVVATQNLLEAMRSAGVREVAFASTGSVLRRAHGGAHPRGRAVPHPDLDLRHLEAGRRGPPHLVRAGLRLSGVDLPLRVAARAPATRTGTSSTSGAGCGATPPVSRCSATAGRRRATSTSPTA